MSFQAIWLRCRRHRSHRQHQCQRRHQRRPRRQGQPHRQFLGATRMPGPGPGPGPARGRSESAAGRRCANASRRPSLARPRTPNPRELLVFAKKPIPCHWPGAPSPSPPPLQCCRSPGSAFISPTGAPAEATKTNIGLRGSGGLAPCDCFIGFPHTLEVLGGGKAQCGSRLGEACGRIGGPCCETEELKA